MILSIFSNWWQKIKQEPFGWSVLLVFAIGLIVLLSIMRTMPYTT